MTHPTNRRDLLRLAATLCSTLLVALPAQDSPSGAAIVLELRTTDPGFAGAAQERLHAPPWDPRPAGDPGSIRVRLRHAVPKCFTSQRPMAASLSASS